MKKLVVLDFDGTIYRGDSLLDFAKFCSKKRYYTSLFAIILPFIACKMGLYSRDKMKLIFLRINFLPYTKHLLFKKGQAFFKMHQNKLYKSAVAYIHACDRTNTRLVILSASCVEWLKPFSEFLSCELISTKLQYSQEKTFTGQFEGENCVGIQKLKALKAQIDLSNYGEIIAFGNSKSDLLLKQIATSYHHCYFS